MTTAAPEPGTVLMYSTPWCGYCRRLKTQFDSVGIGYTEVNIEEDPASAQRVEELNNGNQTVPTVRIAPIGGGDEIIMTNPSLSQVKEALAR